MKPYWPESMVKTVADAKARTAANQTIHQENLAIQDARDKYIAAGEKSISDRLTAQTENQREIYRTKAARTAADVATDRATAQDKLQTARAEKLKGEEWQHAESQPLTPQEQAERFRDKSPSAFIAESAFTAVNKPDGSIDSNASAQKLGQMFDLGDRGGIPRIATLSDTLGNVQTYNKHFLPQQLSNMLVGMANGTYGYRGKPNKDGSMQVEVYRGKVGQGVPTNLVFHPDDYDAVNGIHSDFVAYHKPTDTGGGPDLPAVSSTPPPPVPLSQTTVRPPVSLIQQQPAMPNQPQAPRPLTLPTRVPNEQVPQEWKNQFPELTQ